MNQWIRLYKWTNDKFKLKELEKGLKTNKINLSNE